MEPISFVFADRATVPGFLGCNVQEEVLQHILEAKPDKVLLVSDTLVDSLHGQYFAPLQRSACAAPGETAEMGMGGADSSQMPAVEKFLLPQGDESKSWDHLTALIQWAFSVGSTKRSLVVAFGGGALLNVTGLFASILFRGTKLMYVPTTLLAMHDVVTSLKTSICYDGRKNNIGSFYAPVKILVDAAFCRSLPRGELFSGLGELAKNAALLGGKHAEGFVAALSKEKVDGAHGGSGEEFVLDDETLMMLLSLGIEAKMSVLREDAYEKTSGMIFEYGHTVSHAIEKAYGDGVVPHGLGVTFGMLSSSFAAERTGVMAPEDRREHDELCWLLLARWPLPEPKPSIERIMALAMRDSKRGITSEADDEISDVLLRKMGDVVPTKTSMLSKFPCSLVAEWLASMGFPSESAQAPQPAEAQAISPAQCKLLLDVVGCAGSPELESLGFEPLTAGFANRVFSTERDDRPLIVKRYTDLVFLRLEAEAIGAVDVLAGEAGIGPRVHHSSSRGLVMERLQGRTLTEADMHRGDWPLLEGVAGALAALHQLPVPAVCEGEPMLWRTVDKMMVAAARRPELLPPELPGLEAVRSEIAAARSALERRRPQVVLGHGDLKPSNVMEHLGRVKLIDFELAGPNYRGFDLMKAFRTAANPSEPCMQHFLRAYAQQVLGPQFDGDVTGLVAETQIFEPLTWLEAAVFFLALPQFKPDELPRWHALAVDRWAKFQESRGKLL